MEELAIRRRNLRFLLRCAAFAVVFLLLCGAVLYVLTPKDDYGAGSMMSLYLQPEGSIDVLALGTSMTYAGLNTNALWYNRGIAAYDLACAEQQYWNTYYYLEEALKFQTPRVVVLDAKASSYPNSETKRGRVILSTYGIRSLDVRYRALLDSAPEDEVLSHLLAFPQIHERWKDLKASDFTYPGWTGGRSAAWKGFVEKDDTEQHSKPSLVWTSTKKKLNEREAEAFLRICDLCAQKQVPLLVVAYPNPDYANDHMYYNALWALADARGVPHLNLNDPEGHYRFRYSTEFADWQHVNTLGSLRVSRILGEYLTAHYDLPDRRGDAAWAGWEACCAEWLAAWPQYADAIVWEE